jgi:hypothetical protein
MNTEPYAYTTVQLRNRDIAFIISALKLYDQHIALLNAGVFPISEDELSDLNNDSMYLKGVRRHLENVLASDKDQQMATFSPSTNNQKPISQHT